MDEIKEAFEKLVQVSDAWNNPMMQPVKNGFILGWEAGAAYERDACAKVCEEVVALYDDSVTCGECAAAIRARNQ